jgi:hypothetical protein
VALGTMLSAISFMHQSCHDGCESGAALSSQRLQSAELFVKPVLGTGEVGAEHTLSVNLSS